MTNVTSMEYLKSHERELTLVGWIIFLILPPLAPGLFPVEVVPADYTYGAYEVIEKYCVPGAKVVVENSMMQTAYAVSKYPTFDVLIHLFSKTGPTPGAGITMMFWSTHDWGKAATVYLTTVGFPLIFPIAASINNGYMPVYGEDYVMYGWYPGDVVVGSAIADNVKAVLKQDFYGTPTEDIPMMADINTGADFDFDYHLGTSGTGINVMYPRYGTPLLQTHAASALSRAINYFRAGAMVGTVHDMMGAAQYETVSMERGTGPLTGLGVIGVKGQWTLCLYNILLVCYGNIVYFMRRKK